jgi:VanZ family protein
MWVVTIAWAGFIAQLSTRPYGSSVTGWLLQQLLLTLHIHLSPPAFQFLHVLIRKLAHATEYAFFSLLLYNSFEARHPEGWNTRNAVGAVVIAGLYSLTDEFHQRFVPGRGASLVDCGLDTAGALLGMLLLCGGTRLWGGKSKMSPKGAS